MRSPDVSPQALTTEDAEQARDLVARAQAALLDEHLEGALRSGQRLHALLVPALDRLAREQAADADGEGVLSCGAGFAGLWRDLAAIDPERGDVARLLSWHAARAADRPGPFGLVRGGADDVAAQWAVLEQDLRAAGLQAPGWWRRLALSGDGSVPAGLGDRARVVVQRGAVVVLERLPPSDDDADDCELETVLGPLRTGDRLTLQIAAPLPGYVAVLHAAWTGPAAQVPLQVLLPQDLAEASPRRSGEVVEVTGEVEPVPGAAEQALLVVWAPDVTPPGWLGRLVASGRLAPQARLWRYRYQVEADSAQGGGAPWTR